MRTLVVSEQGAEVSFQNDSLVISLGKKESRRILIKDLQEVMLMGSVELTSGARKMLLKNGIDIIFLTVNGNFIGRATGPPSGNSALRLSQYKCISDPQVRLVTSRLIVHAKILNQRRLLMRAQREIKSEELGDINSDLRLAAERALSCESLEELRGIEGNAAAKYWKGFGMCIKNPLFQFHGRTYRPPLDEVNALLSFGYTFLTIIQESQVLSVGLDPYLGVFHEIEYNRPSLVLDLIEEFRPVCVDSLVLTMLNRKQLAPSDFVNLKDKKQAEKVVDEISKGENQNVVQQNQEQDEEKEQEGVYLGEIGRRIFLSAFFKRMREKIVGNKDLRTLMKEQVYNMARSFKDTSVLYSPFIWG